MARRRAGQHQTNHRPEWLTREQVAASAQLSVRTVDRAIRDGRLRAVKTDGAVRIHRDAVADWLR